MPSDLIRVTGAGGWHGRLDRQPVSHQGRAYYTVYVNDADPILVPTDLPRAQPDGTWFLPLSQEELFGRSTSMREAPALADSPKAGASQMPVSGEELVVPVMVEEVDIQKRRWETGGVRVHIDVREREEVVDQPLTREEVRVDRVPVNEYVSSPPSVREENGTTIIPVLEEVLVVEKRLLLKEEVRITKRTFEAHEPQTVVLKAEEPWVERLDPGSLADRERDAA